MRRNQDAATAVLDSVPTTRETVAPERDDIRPLSAEDIATAKNLQEIARQRHITTPVGAKQAGMSYQEIAENARRQLGTTESTRERTDPSVDKYSPTETTSDWSSEEAMANYNDVGPDRAVSWKRKPGIYAGDRDHIQQLKYKHPDAQIVTRKSDDAEVEDEDIVLVSYPKQAEYRRILDEADRYENWADSILQETQHGSIRTKHADFIERKREAAAAAENRSRNMGIGVQGISETANLPYKVALQYVPRAERLAMEAEERRQGRHITADERGMEALDRRRAEGKGGQQFGGLQGNPAYNKWTTTKDRENAARGRR